LDIGTNCEGQGNERAHPNKNQEQQNFAANHIVSSEEIKKGANWKDG
jgi:hypothetical protein